MFIVHDLLFGWQILGSFTFGGGYILVHMELLTSRLIKHRIKKVCYRELHAAQ